MSIAKLDRLIEKLRGLESFVSFSADEIIKDTKKILIEHNQEQLSNEGHDTEGMPLEYQKPRLGETGRYGWYSKAYEKYKGRRGGKISFVNLKLRGDFNRSIVLIQLGKNNWVWGSKDDKYDFLVAMYGYNILGVSDEFLQDYADTVMQLYLQDKVDKYLKI